MEKIAIPGNGKSSRILRALLALMICLGVSRAPASDPGKDAVDAWAAKIHGGWAGKVAAGSGALPTENQPREKILAKYGELKNPPQKPTSKGPLDDTTLALLGWHAAREHGPNFTTADIAGEWVDHLTDADLKGGGYGREFLDVLARLKRGERPPIRTGSPRAEWIAAQMRAEIWGMLAPGDPARAAEYARRDAEILNVGNGVYAAQFIAALASCLMVNPDIPGAIAAAQQQIPANSRLAGLIRDVSRWHDQKPADWDLAWRTFTESYRDRSLEKRFIQWSPDWVIETDGWPEAEVLDEYLGRKNVLRTHPFSDQEAARLSCEVAVPPSGGTLHLWVTCHELPANVDWLLRLRVEEITREIPIRRVEGKQQWQEVTLDLKPWAGRHARIVMENAALGKMAWEAGYWCAPELRDGDGKPLTGRRPADRSYRYPLAFTPRILPETFSVLAGLLYGEGDFRRSVSLATMCGFDTDCNAGTVGGLLGLRNGLAAIPPEWREPLNDSYELKVTGLPRQWKIENLARQMAETAAALSGGKTAAPASVSQKPKK